MEKPEIVGGLRNALERGASLESAKRSFVTAGYNAKDVEDSALQVSSGGVLQIAHSNTLNGKGELQYAEEKQENKIIGEKKNSKNLILVIVLSAVLLLLLGFLVSLVFFRDKFFSFFGLG